MLELIIIANDNEIDVDDIMLRYKLESKNNRGHLDLCKKFVDDYNLEISNINDLTSYEISIEIAKLGHVNIHVEKRSMIVYIPEILSDKQYKWFKDNRSLLSKFDLSIVSLGENEIVKHIENNECETKSVINKLYRELKKKELLKRKLSLTEENNIKKM